jgi:hypothetical protein
MWGTSLPEEKLAGDLGNVIEATSIGGRQSDFFTAGKLAPGNLGLLQQYLPIADLSRCSKQRSYSSSSSARSIKDTGTSIPSIFAVVRLITTSYLVGWEIGRSAGLAPFRMRSA